MVRCTLKILQQVCLTILGDYILKGLYSLWINKVCPCKQKFDKKYANLSHHPNDFQYSAAIAVPFGIYIFKIINGSTRTINEICSDLSMKTPEQRHWGCSGTFIMLTLNGFHILVWCFHYWLWTSIFNALRFVSEKHRNKWEHFCEVS